MASLIHLGFAIYEFFYFSGSKESKVWAKNLAVYNLCLALTTIFGLQLIFEKKIMDLKLSAIFAPCFFTYSKMKTTNELEL